MVKLILATDMAKHKDLVDQFQKYLPTFDFKNRDHLENVNYFYSISKSINNDI